LALIDLGEISMTLWKDLNAVAFQESGHVRLKNMFLINPDPGFRIPVRVKKIPGSA
jgi:hypothetical protein